MLVSIGINRSSTVLRAILVVGFAVAIVAGVVSALGGGGMKTAMYALANMGLIAGATVGAVVRFKQGDTLTAAGFIAFDIAEAIVTGRTETDPVFASAVLMYIPGLLMLTLTRSMPILARVGAAASGIVFAIYFVTILASAHASPEYGLAGMGFGLQSLAALGWIWWAIRDPRFGGPTPEEA